MNPQNAILSAILVIMLIILASPLQTSSPRGDVLQRVDVDNSPYIFPITDYIVSGNIPWNHDCSNTTGFTYNDSWNITWTPWNIVNATLASDGSVLSISNIPTGTYYHGPMFEYALPETFKVEDLLNFSILLSADNSLTSYVGYQAVILGDADRNPVMFASFSDGWTDSSQGAYGVSYVYTNGSYLSYGSGYPVTWTSFDGSMALRYNESEGLMGYIEGIGGSIVTTLSEADRTREIHYVAIAAARRDTSLLFPMLVDEITIEYQSSTPEPALATISEPNDIEYEAGNGPNVIQWEIFNFTAATYNVSRNGSLVRSGIMNSSSLTVSVDNLDPGVYGYTVGVNGTEGEMVNDSVIVRVFDSTMPLIGPPSDSLYELGSTGNTISWDVSDLYPDEYFIYLDDVEIYHDSWLDDPIVFSIDGLDLGYSNFTLEVHDNYTNSAIDSVIVSVVDTTPPVLEGPTDRVIELGPTDEGLSWYISDLRPYVYELYLNDTLEETGSWIVGNLTYNLLDSTLLGIYNYTIIVVDTSGNHASDTVIVSIEDTIPPVLEGPEDMTIKIGTANAILSWYISDLQPNTYNVYLNGTLVTTGSWVTGNLTYTLPANLLVGHYNFTIIAYDSSRNFASDSVFVSVSDPFFTTLWYLVIIFLAIGAFVSTIFIIRRKGLAPFKSTLSTGIEFGPKDDGLRTLKPVSDDIAKALMEERESISERVREESEKRMSEFDGSDS
ncbi:MAG: hypothetical protein P1Q69_02645 [Candidatus Thorarchaeota archaeon]|nr:hypothetical protein [Candidatus Thorarchaeota archaeon]